LPDIDLLIGMDVYNAADKLQIHFIGIKFEREFKQKKLESLKKRFPPYAQTVMKISTIHILYGKTKNTLLIYHSD